MGVLELEPPDDSFSLVVALYEALAWPASHKPGDMPISLAAYCPRWAFLASREGEPEREPNGAQMVGRLFHIGLQEVLRRAVERGLHVADREVTAVEFEREVKEEHPFGRIVGHIDVLMRFVDGESWILEFKTTTSSRPRKADFFYAFVQAEMYRQLIGADKAFVVVLSLTRRAFWVWEVPSGDNRYREAAMRRIEVLRAAGDHGVIPPPMANTRACQYCPFSDLCRQYESVGEEGGEE